MNSNEEKLANMFAEAMVLEDEDAINIAINEITKVKNQSKIYARAGAIIRVLNSQGNQIIN